MAKKRDISGLPVDEQLRIERKRLRDRLYAESHRSQAIVRAQSQRAKDGGKRNREQRREWYKTNAERVRADAVRYRKDNRDNLRPYWRDYLRARRANDDIFRVKDALRQRIGRALQGKQKLGSAVHNLGCTLEELRVHLEGQFQPDMTWDNYGRGPKANPRTLWWELDHIQPLASFDLTDPEQFRVACHYTNLQPLWHHENRAKSDLLVINGSAVRGRGHTRRKGSTSSDITEEPQECSSRPPASSFSWTLTTGR